MTPRLSTVERGGQVPRGQPVIALAMILAVWIAMRMTFIALEGRVVPVTLQHEDAWQLARIAQPNPIVVPAPQPIVPNALDNLEQRCAGLASLSVPYAPRRSASAGARYSRQAGAADFAHPARGRAGSAALHGSEFQLTDLSDDTGPSGPRLAYGAAASAEMPESAPDPVPLRASRWSADGWLLARGGNQAPGLAARAAGYGGSQAGSVLRYGFAPGSALRPQAYLRASSAIGSGVQQNEVALGLMIRPVRRLPLALLGEWRLQRQPGQTRMRPVVMGVTELPPMRLPYGVEAEAYVQGGWAGGRDATLFYDLSATAQRRVLRPLSGVQLSAGGGVWSGGQRGAARLDVGPRLELRGMVGPPRRRIGVRVGVDWRFRVAGKAEPGSGPALTVAAGF